MLIPVHNHWPLTLNCLRSLLVAANGTRFEVIVADDASSDATTQLERQISWVRFWRSEQNQGFLDTFNGASRLARGELLRLAVALVVNPSLETDSSSIAAALSQGDWPLVLGESAEPQPVLMRLPLAWRGWSNGCGSSFWTPWCPAVVLVVSPTGADQELGRQLGLQRLGWPQVGDGAELLKPPGREGGSRQHCLDGSAMGCGCWPAPAGCTAMAG